MFNMYSYYLQKGHSLKELVNLTYAEQVFYMESMIYEIERENKKYSAIMGGV